MNQKTAALRNTFTVLFIIFFAVATLGGLFWANLFHVQRTGLSLDFLPLWKGANNLLIEGLTPYGEFTTYEIQKMVYGRAAGPGELPLRVGMPLPLLLLFLPLGASSDMELARAAWMVILEIGLICCLSFLCAFRSGRRTWFSLLFLFLLGFLWAFSVSALLAGNAVILLAMFLFGAMLALRASFDELAGMLLALSFFDLETLNGRWRAWAGLLMTLTLLSGVAFIIDSGWVLAFARAVLLNWQAGMSPDTFSLFTGWFPGLGERMAWGLTFLLLLLLMVETGQAFRRGNLQWAWLACLAAAATPLVGLPVKQDGLVFLVPAFLLAASVFSQRWVLVGGWVGFFGLLAALAASWAFSYWRIESGFLWLSLLAIFLLYWVRWWVVRPARLWADQVSSGKTTPY
jgi:hypothetical protein